MDKATLYNIILAIPIGLIFLGLITGAAKFNKLGLSQKLLVFSLCFTFITEVISRILIELVITNYIVFHIYAVIEFAFMATILSLHLSHSERKLIRVGIVLMVVFAVINLCFFQGVRELNTNVITASSIGLVLLSVLVFFRILSKMVYTKIEKSSFFWINIGVLTYFSSSIVLFVFGDWLTQLDLEYSINVWLIHIFFNIIQYLCFNIALWMDPE